jgi:hypothetical protein
MLHVANGRNRNGNMLPKAEFCPFGFRLGEYKPTQTNHKHKLQRQELQGRF